MRSILLLLLLLIVQAPTSVAFADGRFQKTENGVEVWNPKPLPNESAIWIGLSNDAKKAECEMGMVIWLLNGEVAQLNIGSFQGGKPCGRTLIIDKNGEWGQSDSKSRATVRIPKNTNKDAALQAEELRKYLTLKQIVQIRDNLKSAMDSMEAERDKLNATGDPFLGLEASQIRYLWIFANYHRMQCQRVIVGQ